MLCPNCGKEVGDTTKFCDSCDPKNQISEPDPAAEESETVAEAGDSTESAEGEGAENLPALNRKAKSKKPSPPEARTAENGKKGSPLLFFLAGIIAVGVGLFLFFNSKPPAANPAATVAPKSSPSAVSSPLPASSLAPAASPAPSGSLKGSSSAATGGADPNVLDISIDDRGWKESIALWDKDRNEVGIALYAEPLSEEERQAIRSFGGFPVKSPRFIASFQLEPGSTTFSTGVTKSMRTLYSGPESENAGIGFSYVVNKKELAVASLLYGTLAEGNTISAGTKQVGEKQLENGKRLRLSWDLNLKAKIFAVIEKKSAAAPSSTGSPAATEASSAIASNATPAATTSAEPSEQAVAEETASREAGPPPPRKIAEGELGTIGSDGMELGIKDAYALYYPETGAVSIGLFGQELDDSDRAEIQKKKVVTAFVNGKRPSMVLALDFSKKNGEASRTSLLGYTAYFYRDSSGLFYFPGSFDSKSVRRSPKELQAHEFTSLSGILKDGGTLSIRTAGDKRGDDKTKLEWNLSLQVTLHAVQ